MKTIDRITLKGLTFLSNWMYRKFGIDNYTIGMLFVGLAMIATTFIAVMTFRLAETETIEKVVKMRQGGAVMGGELSLEPSVSSRLYSGNKSLSGLNVIMTSVTSFTWATGSVCSIDGHGQSVI